MHITKTFFFIFLFIHQLQAQVQISILPLLTGEELQEELVLNYKPVSVLGYGPARDLLYGTIYNQNDSVSCIYTGHTLYLPPNVDPSAFLFMDGSSNGINAEHAYPRSKGADDDDGNGNGYSDMHHLLPARAAVNSARSNYPFGEIEDSQTDAWYYLNQSQSNTPNTNIDLYSEKITGRFEPREQQKGNIARAVFYFFTMYQEEAINADPDFFESQRVTLCNWHHQDPVDQLEWDRTYEIGAYQNDLPNPFILDSTLATRAYCGGDVEIDPIKIILYPNPTIDWINIIAAGDHALQIVGVLGRTLQEEQFTDALELNLTDWYPGTYFFLLEDRVFRVAKI